MKRIPTPEIIGKKWGRLTAVQENLSYIHSKTRRPLRRFLFRCDCGNTSVAILSAVRRGKIKSCGCYSKELNKKKKGIPVTHGMAGRGRLHPVYKTWRNMKQRCLNTNIQGYENYGGRGIKICDRWYKFENFRDDMLPSWEKGLTLERIDVNKGYSFINCKWIPMAEQSKNRRNSLLYKGKTVIDWARKKKISSALIYQRLSRGWNWERALATKKRKEQPPTRHPLYSRWSGMKTRCNNSRSTNYKHYGARGVKVCKRWNDFKNFLQDMGKTYKKGLSLNRIDRDGPYSPENCEWASQKEQVSNTSRNIKYQGKTMTDWARSLGVSKSALLWRVKLGWPMEKVVSYRRSVV